MTQKPETNSQLVQRSASRYVARLYSGEMTASEERELKTWLSKSDEHRREFDQILSIWDLSERVADDQESSEYASERTARSRFTGNRIRYIVGVAAAVSTLILALVLDNVWMSSIDQPMRYETAIGESRTVELPDGSIANLNTGTQLLVDYTPESRRVILDFGEVYVDVAKDPDPDRRFHVEAGDRVITAFGTEFSVLRIGDDLKVVVEEGTVAISEQGQIPPVSPIASTPAGGSGPAVRRAIAERESIVLQRGGIVEIDRENFATIEVNSMASVRAAHGWRDGVVQFDSQSLINVISELNRYSREKVLIEDSAITGLPVTAILHVGQVELFLTSLEEIYPVTVTKYPDRYVVVGRSGAE
ncbi:MAG: FecR domain-containing protein [Pseudomonadota bacterium]